MFYQDYFRAKGISEKLEKKIARELNQANQEITIRDLFLYPRVWQQSYGETRGGKNIYQQYDPLSRLIDHTASLAAITNSYHQKYYCELQNEEYVIKDSCLNKITRLLTCEFSFYTDTPLDEDEFARYVEAVEGIAKKQHANVHLLLSSFAVIRSDNRLLNICLYVQCGADAKIQIFCKRSASNVDVKFTNTARFTQQDSNDPSVSNISSYVGFEDETTISNNTVFVIKTLGGAEYIQTVDICLDNDFKHSYYLTQDFLNSSIAFIPEQGDQILTSNSTCINPLSKVTRFIVQIDPREIQAKQLETDIVKENDLTKALNTKYPTMYLLKTKEGFLINNPPFGSSCKLTAVEERKLGSIVPSLEWLRKDKNKQLKNNFIKNRLQQISYGKEYLNATLCSLQQLKISYKYLLNKCEHTFFEKNFITLNSILKNEAKSIIQNSINELQKMINNQQFPCSNFIESSIDNLKLKLKGINNGKANNFTNMLIDEFLSFKDMQPFGKLSF